MLLFLRFILKNPNLNISNDKSGMEYYNKHMEHFVTKDKDRKIFSLILSNPNLKEEEIENIFRKICTHWNYFELKFHFKCLITHKSLNKIYFHDRPNGNSLLQTLILYHRQNRLQFKDEILMFIENQLDLNYQNDFGNTALHTYVKKLSISEMKSEIEIIEKFLNEKNLNLKLKNIHGHTIFDLLKEKQKKEREEQILIEEGAKQKRRDIRKFGTILKRKIVECMQSPCSSKKKKRKIQKWIVIMLSQYRDSVFFSFTK